MHRLRVLSGLIRARVRDFSRSWMSPDLAEKQRETVDRQLADMYEGRPPDHFRVLAGVFEQIAAPGAGRSQPLTLLDAGCASGYYSEVLAHLVPAEVTYCGSDFNQGMLDLARQKYPGIALTRMDIRKMGCRDRSFDVVLSGAVLVHVREWQQAVAELARVADTWLILHRTLVSLERASFVTTQKAYGADVYRVHIQEADLKHLLKGLGFDLISSADSGEGASEPGLGNRTYLFQRRDGQTSG